MNIFSIGSLLSVRRAPLIAVFLSLLLLPVGSAAQDSSGPTLRKVARVVHPPISEISGIVKSRRYDNVWWVHNDSGNPARLFAIDSTGGVHMRPLFGRQYAVGAAVDTSNLPPWPGLELDPASNVDYEDIAIGDSTLYLGDIGNNFNARRDLGIYVIPEPYYETQRVRPKRFIRFAYPDQHQYPAEDFHFDAESLVVIDGELYVLTKRWKRRDGEVVGFETGTTLYRLDTRHPHEVNKLTRVDRHELIPPPTAAAPSPSGDRLAVLGYSSVWIFPRPKDGTHWLSTDPRKIQLEGERTKQAEAVTWDTPRRLRIVNEQRDVFVLVLDR